MPRRRKRPGVLDEYEIAWVVRQIAKTTDKPFREIGEEVSNYIIENEDDLSEYEIQIGNDIGGTLERLWPTEGYWQHGEDAEEALALIHQVLGMETDDDSPDDGQDGTEEERIERCTCGIEVRRAREICTEIDCFYK